MSSLTIRNASGKVIGQAAVGSRAVLWQDRTVPVAALVGTEVGPWVARQASLIADPTWQPDVPRLASSREDFMRTIVTVRDENNY